MKLKTFTHKLLSDRKYSNYHMEKDVAADVAQMVLEARVTRGLTQTQLAKKIGTKQEAIARIENGHLPSLRVIEKITKALDMTFIILV
mgnify:CR=1